MSIDQRLISVITVLVMSLSVGDVSISRSSTWSGSKSMSFTAERKFTSALHCRNCVHTSYHQRQFRHSLLWSLTLPELKTMSCDVTRVDVNGFVVRRRVTMILVTHQRSRRRLATRRHSPPPLPAVSTGNTPVTRRRLCGCDAA